MKQIVKTLKNKHYTTIEDRDLTYVPVIHHNGYIEIMTYENPPIQGPNTFST